MANERSSDVSKPADVIFVGGGLACGLAAYRLASLRPDLSIRLLEAGERIGGNHTWSFNAGDLSAPEADWIAPFVAHRWDGYEVRFPHRRRRLSTGYRSVTSQRFRAVIEPVLGHAIRTGMAVTALRHDGVELADGSSIAARCVIDGRGQADSGHLRLGFQKFLGQEIETAAPHGQVDPIIMDATVPQADGYRFVYVLPLGPTRLLVEDTYYADGADLDSERLRTSIAAYCADRGWADHRVLREERGILPIAIDGDIEAFWDDKAGIPAIGLRAGLFHPTTGYSLPDAVRVADLIAGLPELSTPAAFAALRSHAVRTWQRRGFFRMLNRLLFFAGTASQRYRILQHFYRLPDPLVARFYAARLKTTDKIKILTGKPPVPFANAIRVLARHRLTGDLA